MNETAWRVLGVLAFFIYTVGIMLAGALIEKHTRVDATVCRKLTHIVSSFVWVICYVFFGSSLLWVILNGIGAVALGLLTFAGRFTAFGREDATHSVGLFYFGLSTFLVAAISYAIGPSVYLYTGIAYYCLALGDGLAPLVARLFGRHNVTVTEGKTLAGSLTVFAVSFLTVTVFSQIFSLGLSPLFALSVAALTTVAELYGARGTDNLLIEFAVYGYLLLYHYGQVDAPLIAVLIASPFLAFVALGSRSMSAGAGACAFVLFALVGYLGEGFAPVLFIALLFAVSTAVSLVTGRILRRRGEAPVASGEKKGRRAHQIVAVGLLALLALCLHFVTEHPLFYYLYFLALTEQMADSMASDIGRLTRGRNLSIITLKPIEKGLSGGVSLLGTGAALVSAFLFLLLPFLTGALSLRFYVAISLLAFFGTLADSVLGACLQALYACPVCGKQIETAAHCGAPARLVKGFALIDNVAVNHLAGVVTCALGCLLLLL